MTRLTLAVSPASAAGDRVSVRSHTIRRPVSAGRFGRAGLGADEREPERAGTDALRTLASSQRMHTVVTPSSASDALVSARLARRREAASDLVDVHPVADLDRRRPLVGHQPERARRSDDSSRGNSPYCHSVAVRRLVLHAAQPLCVGTPPASTPRPPTASTAAGARGSRAPTRATTAASLMPSCAARSRRRA